MTAFPSPGGLLAPLSPLLTHVPFAPQLASINFLNATRVLHTRSGQRIRFVPPPADGLGYEARVWQNGQVATRPDNWHDFFNALVWLTFPQTKAALNECHISAASQLAHGRGATRDAITHFDECGAIVVASDPSLLILLRAFAWKTLFWERRRDLGRHLRCFVFGHATYEQLLQPFHGLTAKTILHDVTPAWLRLPLTQQLHDLDRHLATQFLAGEHLGPRAWQPLPLLGLPGVTPENESAVYYDDPRQFRPGRRRRV